MGSMSEILASLSSFIDSKNNEIAALKEQNKVMHQALIEIANLPEVRMDESAYIARKGLGQ